MTKRSTLLLTLAAALILLVALFYGRPWQVRANQDSGREQSHNHGQDQSHHPHEGSLNRPMELHSVMRLLMIDLQTINEGIFTQNFDLVASGAASITDHPQLSEKTLVLLEETLGNQLAAFEELDHRAHLYADSIRQASEESNLSRVQHYYRLMEQSCIACHSAFQERLRLARLNAR